MNILNNALGAIGLSKGNLLRNAMKFVGLPEGLAAGVGLVMDVKSGNLGSALFKTGPALLKALTGGQAGQANGAERPSNIFKTALKVAGFAAIGAMLGGKTGAMIGGGLALAPAALGGLSKMLGGGVGIASMLGFAAVGGAGANMLFNFVGPGGHGNNIAARQFAGMDRTSQGFGSALAALPKPAMFEDIVAAFMIDFVKDKQDDITGKLEKLRKSAANDGKKGTDKAGGFVNTVTRFIPGVGRAQDSARTGNTESRNIEFEMLKNEMQKLSQMQQAMSNVLNEMHQLGMNAIRKIGG
jgi:hypothetical protein